MSIGIEGTEASVFKVDDRGRESWAELWDRLHSAVDQLDDLRVAHSDFTEKNRIDVKAQGVRLAISYMMDMGGRDLRG